MERQQIQANIFVAVMVALGVGVLWRWHSGRAAASPKQFDTFESRDVRPARSKEIQGAHRTIEGQLNAFKADDYIRAATFQSIMFKNRFRSPDDFREMIQRFYPEFSRYRTVKYDNIWASKEGDFLDVPVLLTGQDNITVKATYQLHRENGSYRIWGVRGGGHMFQQGPGAFTPHRGFNHGGPGVNHEGPGFNHGAMQLNHGEPGFDRDGPGFGHGGSGFGHGGPGFDSDNPGVDRRMFAPQPS